MASLKESFVIEASGVARFVDAIAGLPNWRSVEVFGPPGSGKSHLCRQASAELGVLTMCDRQAVRFYSAIDFPRTTAMAETLFGRRRMRNYYSLRLLGYYQKYWRDAGPAASVYLSAAKRVRDALPLPGSARRRFDNRVQGSAALIARALTDERRIIADEGLLNQLNSAIARSVGESIAGHRLDLIRTCLAAYPWEKTCLIIDASPENCILRQEARGHVLFTPDHPQSAFHKVTDMVEALCKETGWRTLRINND
jgi:hypothetical protein